MIIIYQDVLSRADATDAWNGHPCETEFDPDPHVPTSRDSHRRDVGDSAHCHARNSPVSSGTSGMRA